MSTQLTTLKSTLNSEAMREQFARALPKHLTPERFTRIAITALTRTPKLQECTQESLMRCLLDLSAMGLEPDGRHAHLIPYRDNKNNRTDCTLIIDYKGLVQLVRRSGDVVSLRAETVCEHDEFAWRNGEVSHMVNWRSDRGKVECVYAGARMASGEVQTAVMTHAEVEAIRKRSRAGTSGPWVTDWAEMAKKTAVRRLIKMLPIASEVHAHIDRDDDRMQPLERNITPARPLFGAPVEQEQLADAATEEVTSDE